MEETTVVVNFHDPKVLMSFILFVASIRFLAYFLHWSFPWCPVMYDVCWVEVNETKKPHRLHWMSLLPVSSSRKIENWMRVMLSWVDCLRFGPGPSGPGSGLDWTHRSEGPGQWRVDRTYLWRSRSRGGWTRPLGLDLVRTWTGPSVQ